MPPFPSSELASFINRRLTWAASLANLSGALLLSAFLMFLLPASRDSTSGYGQVFVATGIAGAIYMPAGLYAGYRQGFRRSGPMFAWLRGAGPADQTVRRLVLEHPMWSAKISVFLWGLAAVIFSVITLIFSGGAVATAVFDTLVLGGVTTSAVVYLLFERILRPVVALALAEGPAPASVSLPGIETRLTMAWTLATGVPLVGVVVLALADFIADLNHGQLVGAIIFLATFALGVGFLAIRFAARGVAEPIAVVRGELERVEQGDLAAEVPVDDGSEVGLLQVGFNRMAAGLREREQLREAFGAFVDPGLTARILDEGTDLAGEQVEVSVMFLDVRGFTRLSEGADAREVVARLNELYEIVVPIVLRHGGHANKFIGDGLLCVFGAPNRLTDHGDRAVAAALEVAAAVRRDLAGELAIGIGVNSGSVVAGTIGGGGRLDFTVIGDTVNTAARVESATRETGDDILITAATRALLTREFGDWNERPAVVLKGKTQPVALFAPAAAPTAATAG